MLNRNNHRVLRNRILQIAMTLILVGFGLPILTAAQAGASAAPEEEPATTAPLGRFWGHITSGPTTKDSQDSIEIEITTSVVGFAGPSWLGSYTVDGEGPYQFKTMFYVFSTGIMYLSDEKVMITLETRHDKGHSWDATVLSQKAGFVGKGQLQWEPKSTMIQIKNHIWVGSWSGTWQHKDGEKTPIRIVVRSANTPTPNPSQLDLPFTLGKTGFIEVGGLKIPFSTIVLDLFRRQIRMTCDESGLTLNLNGKLMSGAIQGTMTSTLRGELGTFDVTIDGAASNY
jgi:hypothetical protein